MRFMLAFALLVGAVPAADAHVFAPALLELREDAAGTVAVRFKQPAVRAAGSALRPWLPESCEPTGEPRTSEEDTGIVIRWEARCPGGLRGARLGVAGIAGSQADVLLRLELAGGESVHRVLTADRPELVVPAEPRLGDVLVGYGRLGVEHILTGFDHLLFVLGLVLLVPGGRRLVGTITAFTVGHSVTLALAVLDLVRVPQGPVEAAIALSIYALAVEIARRDAAAAAGETRRPGFLERSPWLVAGLFGLLHGLGFAGALVEVGLPAGEIPAALFAFNLGIELGQLAFVAAVLALGTLARRLARRGSLRLPVFLKRSPAYGIGALGAFWFFQRTASVLGLR